MIHGAFVAWLTRCVEADGRSYTAIEDALGLPFQSVRRALIGGHRPTERYARQFAEAFNADPDQIAHLAGYEPSGTTALDHARTFPEWLRAVLRERGLSMTAFAEMTGFAYSTIKRWCAGRESPQRGTTFELAQHVGVDGGALWAMIRRTRPPVKKKGAKLPAPQRPWNYLQVRCVEWMRGRRFSLDDLAVEIGVPYTTLYSWFARVDSATSTKVLERLAALLGIPFATALAEAGGQTAEDRHHETGTRAAASWLNKSVSPRRLAGYRKSAETQRGGLKPPDFGEKMLAGRRATGAYQRSLDRMHEVVRRWETRARLGLGHRLRAHPDATRADADRWLEEIAARLGQPLAAVKAECKQRLVEAGLLGAGGAKADDARYAKAHEIVSSWPTHDSGLRKKGAYRAVAREWVRMRIDEEAANSGKATVPVPAAELEARAQDADDVERMCRRYWKKHPPKGGTRSDAA